MEMEAGMELGETHPAQERNGRRRPDGADGSGRWGVLCKSRVGVAGVYLQNVPTSVYSPWMRILWC